MTTLTEHFTIAEFECPTTRQTKFPEKFLDHLEDLRQAYRKPMVVQSGCRSLEHNDWLTRRGFPASPNSFHLMENEKYRTGGTIALDIARPVGTDLHTLMRLATKLGWSVGIAPTFVHLDLRSLYTPLGPNIYTY